MGITTNLLNSLGYASYHIEEFERLFNGKMEITIENVRQAKRADIELGSVAGVSVPLAKELIKAEMPVGLKAVWIACIRGNLDVLEYLVSIGVNPIPEVEPFTAKWLAGREGHTHIVKYLNTQEV